MITSPMQMSNKAGIAVVVTVVLFIICFLIFAPTAWINALSEMAPDEHYENGARIRTIRGQDFVVTGSGSHEHLVPLSTPTNEVELR